MINLPKVNVAYQLLLGARVWARQSEPMRKDPSLPGQKRFEKKATSHSPWLYGTHAVWAAYLNPERTIRRLLLTEAHAVEYQQYAAAAKQAGFKRPNPEIVEKRQLDKLCGSDAVHQGIVCEAAPLAAVTISDLCRSLSVREHAVLLMLDQVTDPHNIGAIIRSAAAFGALAVIVQDRHAPPITGVVAKIASGGVEHVPLVYVTNLSDTLNQLHDAGCQSIALDERGEQTIDVLKPKLALKTCLVLGAEGAGLRPKVRETCTYLARLPTNPNFAALNVSNAAAVGLFALSNNAK